MNAIKTGKLICALRTKQGLTQKQLAEQINVSDKAVSKWERGDGCPDVSVMPVLAKILGIDVENIMNGELPASSTTLAAEYPDKKIKLYDFTRPDKWGHDELHTVYEFFMDLAQKIESTFAGIRNETCTLSISCVDQLNNYEFQRSIPSSCFIFDYDFNNAGYVIEVDGEIGKILLKQNFEEYKQISKFDLDVMQQFFVKEVSNLITENIFARLPNLSSENQKLVSKSVTESKNTPSTLNQNRGGMCCLVSFEINIGDKKGWMNLQLSDPFMDNLRALGFFGFGWKEPELQYLSDISTKKHDNNLTVEIGRFGSEQVNLEVGKILVFDKKYYDPLNLVYQNKVIHTGEAVVVDEHFGIRILDFPKVPEITYENQDYICVQIGACYHSEDEILSIKEKIVLELDSFVGYPSKIIKNGKTVAYGEICIVDDNFGIRITELK